MKKQWILYGLTCIAVVCLIVLFEKSQQQVFKIPILIQDEDKSKQSKEWVKSIQQSDYIAVQSLSNAEEATEKIRLNEASVALIIPKGFSTNLASQSTKGTVRLVQADGLVASIATELISQALYKQQIPYMIKDELKNKEPIEKIEQAYEKNEPKNQLQKATSTTRTTTGSLFNTFFMCGLIFLLSLQVIFLRSVRQFNVFNRLKLYRFAWLKLISRYSVYSLLFVYILGSVSVWILQVQSSLIVNLLWLIPSQIVLAWLFFFVRTNSHMLWMTTLWTIVYSVIYIGTQLMGGII